MSFHITFHKMSIRNQMKTIVILMLALFVLVCALISVSIRALIRRSEDEHMQVATQRLIDQMDLMYGKMENFCINIGEDDAIQALLASDYAQMSPLRRAAMECLARHKILEPTIEDISLVNDKIHYSNVLRGEDLDRIRAMVNGRPFRWIGFCSHSFTSEAEKPDMMVYAGDVIVGTQNLGTIVISLNAADFLAENDGEENQMYFLTDREGVLFSIGQSAEEVYEVYRLWQEGDYPEHLAEGGHYDIRSYYFEDMDCYLVGALDVRDMGRGMTQIQLLIWGCVMAAGVFCALFFLLVSRGVVRPLHQFHATIRQIRQSSQRGLETDLNLRGCSEIEELGHEFSGMLEDIESLNRKIFQSATDLYELKVQKQEAELAYLRSQVDPHFLYNTLEVIRKMALEKDAPEIAQMTLDMGHIFRYSAKGEDEVTLEEEISIIKPYSRIQQMRFEGKISVYYFVSEDVLELKVMKMLLQPIVENSIFHGLEPKSGKGSLYIGAGLELCEQLRRRNEKMQLIIASGYAEFAYAEKAIQYGVIGYCLKPLDYTQMTRFLRKAVQNLNRDRHIGDWEDLVDVLERRNASEIRECLSGLGFTQESCFLAASVGERKMEALEQAGICLRLGWRQWGYIMKTDRVSELAEALEEIPGWFGIGYLEQAVSGGEIYDGLEECNRRAFQYFVNSKERICARPDEAKANRWLDSVQEKLQAGQWGDLNALLEEIRDKDSEDFTVYSALRLCNMVSTQSQSRDEENDSYVYSIEQLVEIYGDFAEMIGRLKRLLEEHSLGAENQPRFSNAAFMKLMQYINENYKGEISLSGAAQVLHMNSNYVSQLFKKEAGITFVHYVTQKRLEDAKELLANTKKPLTDIALEVGFNDTFHFIKTFKKFTGVTPGQYRTNS